MPREERQRMVGGERHVNAGGSSSSLTALLYWMGNISTVQILDEAMKLV